MKEIKTEINDTRDIVDASTYGASFEIMFEPVPSCYIVCPLRNKRLQMREDCCGIRMPTFNPSRFSFFKHLSEKKG